MGMQLTAADAYLFVMLTWTKATKIDISQWPVLESYAERVRARPHVAEALAAEAALRKKV
jgi:glutathione S-transferase